MSTAFFMQTGRRLLKYPLIRRSVDYTGLRGWYHRRLALQALQEPAIAADAPFDRERCLLTLAGSWRQIGKQLAESTLIEYDAEQAKQFRETRQSGMRGELDATIEDALCYLEAHFSEIAALITGASETLKNVSVLDVALASLWPTIIAWRDYSVSCAAMVVKTPCGPILSQNLDLGPSNNAVLAHIIPDDGPARLCHLSPGSLWLGTGVNQFGVTYGGGSVNVARDFTPSSKCLPTSFCQTWILNRSESALQAEDRFKSMVPLGPNHDGISVLVTDPAGSITQVEVTGSDLAVHSKTRNACAAANHFQLDGMQEFNRVSDPVSQAIFNNSVQRVVHAEHYFADRACVQTNQIKKFLRNKRGIGAWSRTAIPPDTGWTTASYAIDLGNARLHYWLGTKPIQPRWRELDLEPLFAGRTYQ